MAEFALGLTKTAVEGMLSSVKSAIEEEAAVKERVQEDLEFITGEFEMMQSFIRGANAANRAAENKVVRTWVKQLRDLAFDVEDCVDFVVSLDTPPWTNCVWRMVPSCCKARAPLLPMDEAVAQIKRLRTRVHDVSQRNARYNLMMDSSATADQNIVLPPPRTNTAASSSSAAAFHILSKVWQAAGKLHRAGTSLKDLMTNAVGNELQVVSIWPGTHVTGTGADLHLSEVTCLIMEAYNDPEIYSEFECRLWVELSKSNPPAAFNKQEFLNSLIAQFCPGHLAAADSKADQLMQRVNKKKYLLVIQGISSVVEWYTIKMYLPNNNNGSRIIVCTQQLRTAVLCTGDPYKVAELTRFSDGQSLCAFSKVSVLRRDIGEFIWQIRRGGVISLLGDPEECGNYHSEIRELYKFVMYKHKNLDGVLVFKENSWVDVPDPFDLEAFCVRLFLGFQSGGFQAKEIAAVGLEGVAQRCRKYLVEGDCLVVINGLQSKEDWDMITEIFLLSGEPMAKDTSIVVITSEASVAAHCADQQNPYLVQGDMVLRRLTRDYAYGNGGKECPHRARLLFLCEDKADYWAKEFKLLGREDEVSALEGQIKEPGVISVWGHPGVGKSAIVRKVYYNEMFMDEFYTDFSWVDVPNRPFDLTDFSWHLLMGFHSHDVEAQERAGVAMLRGENPIEECCRILRQSKCLVVIDGLQSARDWDKINSTFLSSEPAANLQGCIVITDKQRVARHCAADDQVLRVKRLRPLRRPLTTAPPGRPYERKEEVFGWDAEFKLVGRDQEIERLSMSILMRPGVHSLWGVAGVGKSALAKYVYKDCGGKHSWVDVPDPFDLSEFSQQLLLGFHSDDLEAKEIAAVSIMEGHDAVHGSCKIMRENRCILVIDGLRSTHDWDLIRAAFLSETNQGRHRIIVVTHEASIAMHCVDDKRHVLNVKGLNATDALLLFRKIAWCGKEQLTLDEKKFSIPIVANCGGLPKVIAALGEYIAKRIGDVGIPDETWRSCISQEIHHDFMDKLETDSKFQSLRGLFRWMKSYFDGCRDSLKPCIFYLSVFPAGQNIRPRRLLSRWIAEGYSTDTSAGVTAEDNGEKLLAELVKSSIIQERQHTPSNRSNGKEKIVIQVNGFYHGYIISRPMEGNLVFALEERCSINSQRVGQHLTIRSSWNRDKLVYESIDFTRLRSLTVFGEWMSFFISTDANMRVLRVLDLEDTTSGVTDDVLEQIGKLLHRLKFLSLRGCKEITRVPDSFGGLRQLQTLDVRKTKIVSLPHAIMKLVKLQYIHAGTTHEKLDEVDDAGLPDSNDDDDRASTSSEDSLTSIEGGDGKIVGVATPQVDGDSLAESQPLPAASADGDCTGTRRPITADGDNTSTDQLAAADGGGTSTGQPASADGGGTSTSLPGTADDSGCISTDKPAAEDGDGTWQPTTKADNDGTSEPAAADGPVISTSRLTSAGHDMSKRQLHVAVVGDETSMSQLPVATYDDGMITSQPSATTSCGVDTSQTHVSAKNGDGTSRREPETTAQATWRSKAHHVVVSCSHSLLSKKKKSHDHNRNRGVEIPAAALGKLTALHTLGTVDVSGARGKAVLMKIQKLTQLHKLRVCGINNKNWQDLCDAISHLGHLESFSVWLDQDEDASRFFCSSDAMFSSLPKNLKSLKLYTWGGGAMQVSPVWLNKLNNLRKVNFDLKISTQEDIDTLVEMPNGDLFPRQCVKPTQAGELRYGWWGDDRILTSEAVALEIDCGGYNTAIVFGPYLTNCVEELSVHCSSKESFLELSGLEYLWFLREVTLKGSYSEAVERHLKQQLDDHKNKPELKLEEGESHQSPEPKGPAASCACCHTYASCCFNGMISTCK